MKPPTDSTSEKVPLVTKFAFGAGDAGSILAGILLVYCSPSPKRGTKRRWQSWRGGRSQRHEAMGGTQNPTDGLNGAAFANRTAR
jgi:hypothetical protein